MLVLLNEQNEHILNIGSTTERYQRYGADIKMLDACFKNTNNNHIGTTRERSVYYESKHIENYYSDSYRAASLRKELTKRMLLQEERRKIIALKVRKIVKDIFPDTSDCVIDNLENLHINILFPKIKITNGKISHDIEDIYIKFIFIGGLYFSKEFYGIRGKLSLIEANSYYGHSHIDPRYVEPDYSMYSWGAFCTGPTDLADSLYEIKTCTLEWKDTWELEFELLLCRLKDLLSWESLEGVPFCHINTLVKTIEDQQKDVYIETADTSEIISFLEKEEVFLDLQFEKSGEVSKYCIKTDIEPYLLRLARKSFLKKYCLLDFGNGVFMSLGKVTRLLNTFKTLDKIPPIIPNFTYKEKQILLNLTDYAKYKKPSKQVSLKINNNLVENIKHRLEKKINLFTLTKTLDENKWKKRRKV